MRKTLLTLLALFWSCDLPSNAVVDNQFADTYSVERVWWQTTLFTGHVAPGQSSEKERTVPGTAIAWAVLSTPAVGNLAVRSTEPLVLSQRGDLLHIALAPDTVVGLCGVDGPLSTDDAAEAALIFPDELMGSYDPTTCTYSGATDAGP